MTRDTTLRAMERKIFRSFYQDGLLDLFLGLMLAQFATTPIFDKWGIWDFWYSAVWLSMYTTAVFGMNWAKRHIVGPRLGRVRFSLERKAKLRRFTWFAVVFSTLMFAAALAVALMGDIGASDWIFPIVMALGLLLVFSSLGAVTHAIRFYFYGIWISAASFTGEMLYRYAGVPHHGFPLSFGTSSLVLIGIGAFLFVRFLQTYPPCGGEYHG
jgi:hypothetical protein